jgi:hypothetical protein
VFDINWNITVGNYKLLMLDNATVTHSVEQLSDTAEIVLPGSHFNKTLDIEDKFKRGDAVLIQLGYNVKKPVDLVDEFNGFVESISTDDGSIKIKCEDGLFKFRVAVVDKEFVEPTLKDILNYVLQPGYTLDCNYSFSYDKFVILNCTAYEVLKKIQEETNANIYLKDKVLHIHPQYENIFGTAKYSFQANIEKSDLEYKKAEDRPVLVTIEGKGRDGKVIKQTAGVSGGDTITKTIPGVSSLASLKLAAEEQLKVKSYTGYSGSFTGWLVPYCDAGYKVILSDSDYEYKSGNYYVTEVVTKVGKSGGSRQVKLGKKISA